MTKQRIIPNNLLAGRGPAKHTRTIRCGLNHSGNRSLTDSTVGFAECLGCGAYYTIGQVAEAAGRQGAPGSMRLYDSAVS